MAEVPSVSLWPPGFGAEPLRRWARAYATQYGFTSPTQRDPPAEQAFRHALVASATYLEAYNIYRNVRGLPASAADRWATARTLGLGNINEVLGPNPLSKHLMDFWNNYEGVLLAREAASKFGASIPNDRLAQIVAGEINASIQAPLGKSRFILFNGADQPPNLNFKDPRLDVNNYDTNRLPNEGWGMGPFLKVEGNVPPAIVQAFPKLYQSFPQGSSPKEKNFPDIPSQKADPNPRADSIAPGQESSEQGQRQDPPDFGATEPQMPNRQLAEAGQSGGPPQVGSPTALNLPRHVIDTGNYLRANGIEITPRSMYVANFLGPQRAVDLIKRTGSTSSDAVPSPDATTGRQMLAWVRQLRLGPASPAAPDFGAPAAPAPAAPTAWNNAAVAPQGDVSEDAGMPVDGPAAV
jgi:hypothetical protein